MTVVFSVIHLKQGTTNTSQTVYSSGNADMLLRLKDQGLDKQAYCSAYLASSTIFLFFNNKLHLLIPYLLTHHVELSN